LDELREEQSMTLIEQAAKRLEELRRAGAETAGDASGAGEAADNRQTRPERLPTPEAAMRGLDTRASVATTTAPGPTADAGGPRRTAPLPGQQRRVEIDLEGLKARGFVTPDTPRSQIADEFRIIKRPIIRNAHGTSGVRMAKGNLIMVTSALPREGKTFTAINLAMSMAMEVNTTVLLVDGDVAHPDLPNLLGVPTAPGLLDVLTRDDLDIGDVLVRTNIDNLMVLPAGSQHRRATELLASEQMASILRELAARYADRLIIFDSPPLLATTEARVLATHMGQIVMVVAADSTRQQAVNLALSTIESCEMVMMMLNKASQTEVGAYYEYYAGDAAR
jgi:receptor protein-tyrosine kinase